MALLIMVSGSSIVLVLLALLGAAVPRQHENRENFDPRQSQATRATMTTVTVEIDIFSGLPNPQWTLSDADHTILLARLAELQPTMARPRAALLGYRGLIVRVPQHGRHDLNLYVQNGTIEWDDGTTRNYLRDPKRSLERWLVATGKKLLSREIFDALDASLRN